MTKNFDKFCSYILLEQKDENYLDLAKDPDKNKDVLQEMVRDAAVKNNYKKLYFHGTKNLDFKDLRLPDPIDIGFARYGPGIYLANPNDQKTLNVYSKNGRIIKLYVNDDNLLKGNLSTEQLDKILENFNPNLQFSDGTKSGDWLKELENLKEIGHLWHILYLTGHGKFWYEYMNLINVDGAIKSFGGLDDGELVIYNKNVIKSADTVTYDDNGNIIPLSRRFDSSEKDIRY